MGQEGTRPAKPPRSPGGPPEGQAQPAQRPAYPPPRGFRGQERLFPYHLCGGGDSLSRRFCAGGGPFPRLLERMPGGKQEPVKMPAGAPQAVAQPSGLVLYALPVGAPFQLPGRVEAIPCGSSGAGIVYAGANNADMGTEAAFNGGWRTILNYTDSAVMSSS